jgi:hypothetical protein
VPNPASEQDKLALKRKLSKLDSIMGDQNSMESGYLARKKQQFLGQVELHGVR